MVEVEEFELCAIKRDLTNMTLNISQPYIIDKIIKGFNRDVKSLMTCNTPAIPYKGILRNQGTDTKIS